MTDPSSIRSSARARREVRRIAPCLTGVTLALALGLASADDTEIYFGTASPQAGAASNVLLVLDTSGSMRNYDGTSQSRLERMKDALDTIIDTSENVNIGLMRFNGRDGGSSVIYPVTPIDGTICEGAACTLTSVTSTITDDRDDVEENLPGSWNVSSDGFILSMSQNGNQAVGLRFRDLDVPQGATIVSANLEFVAYHDRGGAATLNIGAEASDDAAPFADGDGDVSGRPLAASASWEPEPWTKNERYVSSDLSAVVQAVTDRSGWCGGNAMAFVVTGSGDRSAQSWHTASDPDARGFDGIDAARSAAPRLNVTYTIGDVPSGGGCTVMDLALPVAAGSDDAEETINDGKQKPYVDSSDLELPMDGGDRQLIGLRFDDVPLERDTETLDARIEFQVDENDGEGFLTLRISAEDEDDPGTYRSSEKEDISKRDRLPRTVTWADVPYETVGTRVTTPDIAPLVNDLLSRGGWTAGNAMAFMIERTDGSGSRTMESFEGGTPPVLKLRYRGRAAAGDPIQKRTVRDELKLSVEAIDHAGGTPIVDALYEAGLYMRGDPVDYGRQRGADGRLLTTNRISHEDSWSGGSVYRPDGCTAADPDAAACREERIEGAAVYDSPIASTCQGNHIVMLTDGQASANSSAAKVRSLTGESVCAIDRGDEACGQELAEWLYTTDHAPQLEKTQTVRTHTIGFNFSGNWLKSLADEGGGSYHEASQAADLAAAFQSIIGTVVTTDTSFVAPAATVNQFNRLTHENEIYFALFKPSLSPRWRGNLKRYAVGDDGVVDADGKPAVDASTGFFADNARSGWSEAGDDPDGADVTRGGAVDELVSEVHAASGGRRTYTFTGDAAALHGSTATADLTADAHALEEDNAAITAAMLGIEDHVGGATQKAAYRQRVLKWGRGADVLDEDDDDDLTELRAYIGDPMHSRPTLVTYNTAAGERTSVYMSTNEGYLHSIDGDTGKENYAFMPKALLGNIETLMLNDDGSAHPYGLDGSLSVRVDDANNNTAVDEGERAFLYSGMRRGGRNYYALDVSAHDAPKLAWVIEGGPGGTDGFGELGQSWSRPVPSRVMLDGTVRDVVIFGAGYDDKDDTFADYAASPRRAEITQGRGFYIVDALTGEKLHSVLAPGVSSADANPERMTHSVPGDIRVIDVDFDGLADQLWFGDTGGQIWRFDIAAYHQSGDERPFIDGGVVADIGGTELGQERRFHYEPDVSLIGTEGKRTLAISIGSGWRAHPLDTTVEDRFYVLRSDAVYGKPQGYGRPPAPDSDSDAWLPITESDLVALDDDGEADPATSPHGWYFDLPHSGEKVLGDSITVNNQVIFTTYRPEAAPEPCSSAIGGGSVYVLDIRSGAAAIDMDGDGTIEASDRDKTLVHGGIPPQPVALITDDGPVVLVGPEQPVEPDFGNLTRRSYWIDHGGSRPAAAVPSSED